MISVYHTFLSKFGVLPDQVDEMDAVFVQELLFYDEKLTEKQQREQAAKNKG